MAGGIGDESPCFHVGAKEEAGIAEEPLVEDVAEDRGEHLREAAFGETDLNEAVAAGKRRAEVLGAEIRVAGTGAERLRDGRGDAVGQSHKRVHNRIARHNRAGAGGVVRGDNNTLATNDVHFVDVVLVRNRHHFLPGQSLDFADMPDGGGNQVGN